ncbi:hypothetical protein DDD_1652 [Nonlabens dokdonensis DSW-6]|jgi:hypothetical protein|uniref:Uncharacterized protein n=1 Tax=Nonlabens dokdonensis (strain DSM 17205 / KCTC 12402 / DSW-6) TaxID=592029 RepID=L7W9G9_NONDD|nr:hypothetical protein DDD_1652 [Nonlabens dokdonensis DSW-6]
MTLSKTEAGLILKIYNLKGLVSQYLVLSIKRNDVVDEILLKRMSKI